MTRQPREVPPRPMCKQRFGRGPDCALLKIWSGICGRFQKRLQQSYDGADVQKRAQTAKHGECELHARNLRLDGAVCGALDNKGNGRRVLGSKISATQVEDEQSDIEQRAAHSPP